MRNALLDIHTRIIALVQHSTHMCMTMLTLAGMVLREMHRMDERYVVYMLTWLVVSSVLCTYMLAEHDATQYCLLYIMVYG